MLPNEGNSCNLLEKSMATEPLQCGLVSRVGNSARRAERAGGLEVDPVSSQFPSANLTATEVLALL